MVDLIDRDKLKKSVLKWLPSKDYSPKKSGLRFNEDLVVSLMMEIEEQPTVDAVQYGRWIWNSGYGYWECTNCNKYVDKTNDLTKGKTKYCPHCGAKMGGK